MENNHDIKVTPLHSRHVALGAQMSPFAGYDMPIQYEGITEEHNVVRNGCGVFDVSHMGEVTVDGPEAERFVNHIFTNDITDAPVGKVFYGMMLHEDGGTVDDLLVYKRGANSFLLVINAANIAKDVDWIMRHAAEYDVKVTDISDFTAQIAVQGPLAEQVLSQVLRIDGSPLAFYTFEEILEPHTGKPLLLSRTGYTGEDGFELYAEPEVIEYCWDRLIESGECKPCGLGCRDTLRFEVGLPLYGDELSDTISPIEAGLGMFVKLDKPEGFIGRDACAAQKADGVKKKLVGLEILDRAIARHGAEVLSPEGEVIGTVTTGYRGISVDKSIAVALIDARYASKDQQGLSVRVRRKTYPVAITPKRFYKKSYKQ